MDLSKLSTKDLLYLRENQLDKVSTQGLMLLKQMNVEDQLKDPESDASKFRLTKEPASRAKRFMMGLEDPVLGIAQLAEKGYEALGGTPMDYSFSDYAKDRESKYAPTEGLDVARIAGNILNPLTLVPASRIPQATTLAGKVGLGATTGAGFSAMTPVTGDDFAEEKKSQLTSGGLIGALFPVGGSAISRVVSPKASTNAQIKMLQEEGISPTVGELLGGSAKKIEEGAMNIPIIGNIIQKAKQANVDKFRNVVFKKVLEPIDETLPKNMDGRQAVDYISKKLGTKYDDVLDKIGSIKLDDDFIRSVDDLSAMIENSKLPAEAKQEFIYVLDPLKQSTDEFGRITSEAYKEIESKLSKQAVTFNLSTSIYSDKLASATKQLKQNLKDLLKRHATKLGNVDGANLADELSKVNNAWSKFKRLQKAAGTVQANLGEFTPAQFNSAVKAADKSKDKGAFAAGQALMQDLSESGSGVLTSKFPSAQQGVTNQLLSYLALGGSAYALPQVTIPSLIGSGLLYNPAGQKILNTLIAKRPEMAPQVAEAIRRSVPYATGSMPSLLVNQPDRGY